MIRVFSHLLCRIITGRLFWIDRVVVGLGCKESWQNLSTEKKWGRQSMLCELIRWKWLGLFHHHWVHIYIYKSWQQHCPFLFHSFNSYIYIYIVLIWSDLIWFPDSISPSLLYAGCHILCLVFFVWLGGDNVIHISWHVWYDR